MAITTSNLPTAQTFALFEASSIKQFIIEQLNAGGIYIDQKYLGSNLNAFIEIIAVMLQQLQFHYNTTATESTFGTVSLFENMNKLVSLFNYKPSGKQTSILPISITYNNENINSVDITKLIPRYSYINYNKSYIFREDISINLTNSNIEDIMFQGNITESPIYRTTGEDFQTFILADTYIKTSSEKFISDNFFDVYVREPEGKWIQYKEVNSLFESGSTDCVFERRLNENFNYEFKFGNSVNGYRPAINSEIIIYYIISDGENGIISNNTINNTDVFRYTSSYYEEIMRDISNNTFGTDNSPYFSNSEIEKLSVSNTGNSTKISSVETTDLMRTNVPKLFVAQNRLLTANDYMTYVNKMFNTFVKDTYVFNNDVYTGTYLKYFYDIGLKAPNDDSRVLLNQVNFQTSCAFNNIYIVLLPLVNTIIDNKIPNFVNESLKQYIVNSLESYKDITHNITPIDPIYKAVSFGITRDYSNSLVEDFSDVKLILIRDKYSNFNAEYIINRAVEVFKAYYDSIKLGDNIDINRLSSALLAVPGIKSIKMSDGTNIDEKLTLIIWNPLYEESDFTVTQQNISLDPFVYHYFYDIDNLKSKITVVNE